MPSAPLSGEASATGDVQQHAQPMAAAVPPPVESEEAAALARAIEGSAFSTWKESLSLELESESKALKARVHSLQSEFDEASVFIRGDLAWRKQLGAFHDKVNDILQAQMESLVTKLKQNADALSHSVTESFERKDEHAKLAMEWQVKMYEDKLRRTRTSLKKEIDRFSHLEKCLRKEEAFQAKEMYDDLVLQLTTEHAAREASLHAVLRELRSSYNAMELGNTHLMDSLKAARAEVERMKKMLVKQTSSLSNGSPRKSSVRSPSRFASSNSNASMLGGASSISDVYVQSLKQSLSTSAQTIESLKKQVAELTSEKESSAKRIRQVEDATSRVNDELAKVTQLLSESHTALIASAKAMEKVESEKVHWKELFAELQFRTGSNDQEIEAAKQLADVTKEHIASLEQQTRRLTRLESSKQKLEGAFADWLDNDPERRDSHALQRMLESFFDTSSDHTSPEDAEYSVDVGGLERRELETKLRYEFEMRYGEQLNLRVSHERKRVLARIEMLCASQGKPDTADPATPAQAMRATRQQLKQRTGVSKASKIPYKVVHKIVSDAYDHLGFSEWCATDVDFLHTQIESLQAQIAQHKSDFRGIERFAEAQGMALARADLLQQEKEFLLAELTDKYRGLRAAQDALHQQPSESSEAPDMVRLGEVPLTVYGHPQRLELKKLRSRPASASPCLVSGQLDRDGERERDGDGDAAPQQQCVLPAKQQRLHTKNVVRPMSSAGPLSAHSRLNHSRLGLERASPQHQRAPCSQSPSMKPFLSPAFEMSLTEPQQVEHIRSILKTELLQLSPPENQLEDGSHLGPDGILQIIQRRRNRK